MKSENGIIFLEQPRSIDPKPSGLTYTDESGIKIHIPMDILIRFYELTKFDLSERGIHWGSFCEELINGNSKTR